MELRLPKGIQSRVSELGHTFTRTQAGFYTVQQLSHPSLLGCSTTTIYTLMKSGELPFVDVGARRLFHHRDLERIRRRLDGRGSVCGGKLAETLKRLRPGEAVLLRTPLTPSDLKYALRKRYRLKVEAFYSGRIGDEVILCPACPVGG